MSEKLLEKRLREKVKLKGGLALKLSSTYHNGLPDRLVLTQGGIVNFVELKTTGAKPRALQARTMSILRSLGFNTYVVDSHHTLESFLAKL